MSKNSVAPTARLAHNAGALAYHHAAKKEDDHNVPTHPQLSKLVDLILRETPQDLKNFLASNQNCDQLRNKLDHNQMAAMHYAGQRIQPGSREIVRILVDKKFDLSLKQPSSGKTILHFAIEHDNTALVKFLIGQKSVNVTETAYASIRLPEGMTHSAGNNLLHFAVARGNRDLVELVSTDKKTKSLCEARNQLSLTPLELAMMLKNEQISKILLGKITGHVNESLNKMGDPLLHWAIKMIDLKFLETIDFLNQNQTLDLRCTNRFGQSILSYLVRLDKFDEIKFVFQVMKTPNLRRELAKLADRDGTTALMFAIRKANTDIVKFLMDEGADVNHVNEEGFTPLMTACVHNKDSVIVDLLMERGAGTDQINSAGQTALHLLAQATHIPSMLNVNLLKAKLLVEEYDASVDISTGGSSAPTALFTAILSGNFPFTQYLLQAGADVNLCNANNESVLFIAVTQSNSQLCNLLLEHYPQLSLQDSLYGQSVFHIAASLFATKEQLKVLSRMLAMVKSAKRWGAGRGENQRRSVLDLQDSAGQTPLHKAVIAGNLETLGLLLKSGAAVYITDNVEHSILHKAVLTNNVQMVARIFRDIPNYALDQTNKLNQTVLHMAAVMENPEIVSLIMDRKESRELLNARDQFDRTALHYAVEGNRKASQKVVQLLITAGCDPEITDQYNETPVEIAKRNPNSSLIDTIMDTGERAKHTRNISQAFKLNRVDLVEKEVGKLMGDQSVRSRESSRGGGAVGADNVWISKSFQDEQTGQIVTATKNGASVAGERVLEEIMKQTDARGRSPVHIAAEEGNMDMMRALTQSFIEHNDSAGLTKLLSLADRSGNTPLHLMVFNFQHKTSANNSKANYTALKEFLLGKQGFKLNPNAVNNNSESLLHLAAAQDNVQLFRQLYHFGTNPNCRDSSGYKSVHVACKSGSSSIVAFLLSLGCNINSCTYENNSPLHICAFYNASTVAEMLISYGVDGDIKNNTDKTAEAVAIEQNHTNFIRTIWQLNAELKGYIGPNTSITSRDMYGEKIRHDNIRAKFPSIIENYPVLADQVLDYYLIPMARDQTTADELSIVVDLELFECDSVRDNPLIAMVTNMRGSLLSHPVTKTYMFQKWSQFTVFYYSLTFALYFITALLFSAYTVEMRPVFLAQTPTGTGGRNYIPQPNVRTGLYLSVVALCLVGMVLEVVPLVLLKSLYWSRVSNWYEFAFFAVITLTLVVYYFLVTDSAEFGEHVPSDASWFRLTVVLFLLWINVGFHIRQNQYFGIYIVMLFGILATFFKLLLPLAFFLLAPALCLYVINPDSNPNFRTPVNSAFKSFYMVIGTYAGDENENAIGNWIEVLQAFLALFFIFFVTIVMMNLITAVAIGDVQAAEKNAEETKLELSANLIIETEFFRRKILRRGNSKNKGRNNELWKLDDSRSFGLTRIFEGLWGRSILSKSRIIQEIRERYLNKYDFDLVEQEMETAMLSTASGLNMKELQTVIERELRKQQLSLIRALKSDFEPISESIDKLNDRQNITNEQLTAKFETTIQNMSEDIKKFVPSDQQLGYEQKLNSLLNMGATRKKIDQFDGELSELKNYMGKIDRRLADYKEFIDDTPLESMVDLRKRGRQSKP